MIDMAHDSNNRWLFIHDNLFLLLVFKLPAIDNTKQPHLLKINEIKFTII